LREEKKQQIISLGKLGLSLRRIERTIDIRRETAAGYLKAAGIAIQPPRGWGTPHADKTGQRGDHRFAWNTRIVRNAANPIDSPQIIIVRKGVDGVNSFPHRVDDNQLVTPSQTGYFQDLQISVANSVECAVAVSVTQITVSRIYRGI
jgi:hypothetical protein